MNICLIFGLLCLVYGLTVAIAGSGGTKFFIVWIGIAVILYALAGLLHMGIWDRMPQMIRWIFGILCGVFFLSFLVIEGMVIRQMHAQGEDNLDYVIVLGAQVHADKPSVVLKYRLDEAILYLNENPEFPIVKDTTPNMMNPRLYTTSYNKPQGQQFDDTAVLSFIKLQYT